MFLKFSIGFQVKMKKNVSFYVLLQSPCIFILKYCTNVDYFEFMFEALYFGFQDKIYGFIVV